MRRNRAQTVLGIFDLLAAGDRKKTEIVYTQNLNAVVENSILSRMVERGQVVWREDARTWQITPAGRKARGTLRKSLAEIEEIL